MMARFNSASAAYAQSYLLITVLAAILGGIDPFGGFGRMGGLVVALLVLQTIASGFNLLGLNPYLTLTLWGLTLLFVMAVKRASAYWRSRVPSHRTRHIAVEPPSMSKGDAVMYLDSSDAR
jgi:simple sugar transport system permease protein